jgi:hypothetical protein
MSPTEHDLRGALHDGEGDGTAAVDVDRLISAANARRAQRRVRVGGALTAAALVVVGATAIVALRGGDSSVSGDSAYSARSGGSSVRGAAGGAAASSVASAPSVAPGVSSANPSAAAGATAVRCPASLPRPLLPGGGSPGQFGSGGALFAQPVASVVVCGYGTRAQALDQTSPPAPTRLVLAGAQAQELADSLENADKNRAHVCPTTHAATADEFALYGLTATGQQLRGVTVSLTSPTCQSMITNGTAVRYAWSPPAELRSALRKLRPTAAPS